MVVSFLTRSPPRRRLCDLFSFFRLCLLDLSPPEQHCCLAALGIAAAWPALGYVVPAVG